MTDEPWCDTSRTTPHRLVAGVLIRDLSILLCHRHPARAWFPNVWDLPGGHVEAGESEQEALRRECREELDVTIGRSALIELVQEPGIALSVYLVNDWVGQPRNAATVEHDQIRWFHTADLASVHLADHRYLPLINKVL